VLSLLARVLHLASLIICLIAAASFVLFVVNQTSSASTHQQEVINTGTTNPASLPVRGTSLSRESSLHRAIDEASNELTSPFKSVTAGSSSQWAIRGANLLLVLIVYGFGLGFLARMMTVRT
jgi:predicted PurR-regulated permease PerM